MTPVDMRDLTNHVSMFGPAAICRKSGRKWAVSFREFGFPSLFTTKTAAIRAASDWSLALSQRMREAG